jgi:hypothetical protein
MAHEHCTIMSSISPVPLNWRVQYTQPPIKTRLETGTLKLTWLEFPNYVYAAKHFRDAARDLYTQLTLD